RIDFSRTISDNTICRNNYYSYFLALNCINRTLFYKRDSQS
ncbi:ABC transporter ATP-binding protein, partial [Enterococcus faecalis]|nr:ABC transporter ATP-binding protein [Enterococcus faecalis]